MNEITKNNAKMQKHNGNDSTADKAPRTWAAPRLRRIMASKNTHGKPSTNFFEIGTKYDLS